MLKDQDRGIGFQLKNQDIERRLSLYQIFISLYEQHSHLLNDILQLDNLSQSSWANAKPYYIQGVIDESAIYVITNLCNNQTQTLQQPQLTWTIGRDRNNGISTYDKLLSRHHAAVQYIDNQGFYLIDFNSTNGSFVNGEQIYQPVRLKDGDIIRLGSLTFNFFLNYSRRLLPTVTTDFLKPTIPQTQNHRSENSEDTVQIFIGTDSLESLKYEHQDLKPEHKSEILDCFFQRQI
ncbi:FHA domain containing protein [Trichormus variabilis ATCC 29413]|uniref:FHA domain containing protein n=2 Tax=Anabaena variabilis TaxID=264691 RepID=Q3M3B5_TRIV2|nr:MULTISPECIES: FHA domain-containing protein [Nostocaceae]ABA24521.1 FHA domain containing protein [Trichormus variabilis ATCC 29413]MBC1212879.1 FHA domain-containing protein [Trichormus variabilis ARAD]MBC1258230.1 FHA domain-containing protein [Trichormus variabilis V5]MBC1266026.1 FHA domain-containing protein [Trichormus variabilis FSR]MBC1301325.1 FHA domain-containing protein [Trichormus variabilis N2B]